MLANNMSLPDYFSMPSANDFQENKLAVDDPKYSSTGAAQLSGVHFKQIPFFEKIGEIVKPALLGMRSFPPRLRCAQRFLENQFNH